MEYNIRDFVNNMRERMYNLFPYESDFINYLKHIQDNKNPKPKHIRDVAFMQNPVQFITDDLIIFEIGNEESERDYPYYHILEEAPVIRIKGYGTKKTKGSQENIKNKANRDYNVVNFNGKTFTKEYARNVRGSRSNVVKNARNWVVGLREQDKKVINPDTGLVFNRHRENTQSNSYKNYWYQYIETILSSVTSSLAIEYNMKLGRTKNSGLGEEYVMDNYDIKDYDYDSVSQWVSQIINM